MEPGRTTWTGFHYDGHTASREPVTVGITAQGLHIAREGGESFVWPFEEIRRVAPLHRGERLRLERGGEFPESVVVGEDGLLEALHAMAPVAARQVGARARPDDSTQATVAKIGLGLAALAAIYFWGLPAFASLVAPRVPVAWEEELGRGLVERMAPSSRRCADPTRQAALEAILNRLVATTPASRYHFTLLVADDSVINAFAAPGGYVVVNLGLLKATKTPEELAGVLAHEVQHVLLHHHMRALAREVPLRIAVAALFGGDASGAFAARAASTLGALRYQRGDELEADREGLVMLQAAHVDPRGMVDFFNTLAAEGSEAPRLVTYLSTHPQTADRIAQLQRLVPRQGGTPTEPLVPDYLWAQAGEACTP